MHHFCGGTGSSVAGAMEALAEKHTRSSTPTHGAASLTGDKCNRNFFRTCANSDMQSYALAHWVAEQASKRSSASPRTTPLARRPWPPSHKKLKELNPQAEIVGQVMHPMGTKDFAPYVSQIITPGLRWSSPPTGATT